MVSIEEQESIARTIIDHCDEAIDIWTETKTNVAQVYAKACSIEGTEDVAKYAEYVIGQEHPFTDIQNIAYSIVNGWAGWSAVHGNDDLRTPEYVKSLLEYNDLLYYLPRLSQALEDCPMFDGDLDGVAVIDANERLNEKVDGILYELEPLIGMYIPYK